LPQPPCQFFRAAHRKDVVKDNLNVIYIAGPGHGAPATLAHCYLEGHCSGIYPDRSEDEAGVQHVFLQFSFPGGIGSHRTPKGGEHG
jgi:xylulose-5-phosphate/fructose-6-phosphate phosphoketolase